MVRVESDTMRVERTKQRLAGMKLVSLGLFEWNCNSIKDLLTFFPEWGPREWQKKDFIGSYYFSLI